jgi:hypothetical protein
VFVYLILLQMDFTMRTITYEAESADKVRLARTTADVASVISRIGPPTDAVRATSARLA